ncbi:MAG: hypothetical protein LBQ70_03015 [Prevotellaceae bacterium]|jgi:hypothetical protein|nr:hypothetical protein [Prevotellaceae bacterium]
MTLIPLLPAMPPVRGIMSKNSGNIIDVVQMWLQPQVGQAETKKGSTTKNNSLKIEYSGKIYTNSGNKILTEY